MQLPLHISRRKSSKFIVNYQRFENFPYQLVSLKHKGFSPVLFYIHIGSRRPSRSTTRPGSTAPGIRDLVGRDILAGQSPARESPSMDTAASRSDSTLGRIVNPKHRICRVVFANDNAKLGVSINNKEPEGTPHRILTIQPSSLAEEAGMCWCIENEFSHRVLFSFIQGSGKTILLSVLTINRWEIWDVKKWRNCSKRA